MYEYGKPILHMTLVSLKQIIITLLVTTIQNSIYDIIYNGFLINKDEPFCEPCKLRTIHKLREKYNIQDILPLVLSVRIQLKLQLHIIFYIINIEIYSLVIIQRNYINVDVN